MSETPILQPLEQRTIIFYDDEITAVLVEQNKKRVIYVPVRPICDFLGVDWSAQRQRINRDAVLSVEASGVVVTPSPLNSKFANPQKMLCLPLDFLNGWLFGINANRVKQEIREQLIRYQRDCYRVLADAFLHRPVSAETDAIARMEEVRQMGLAIARMAEEQIAHERRIIQTENRLDKAAIVVADNRKRIVALEKQLITGDSISDAQASEIAQAVRLIAMFWSKQAGHNQFGAVYGRLYETFGITSYKRLPIARFAEAMQFLDAWYKRLTED